MHQNTYVTCNVPCLLTHKEQASIGAVNKIPVVEFLGMYTDQSYKKYSDLQSGFDCGQIPSDCDIQQKRTS